MQSDLIRFAVSERADRFEMLDDLDAELRRLIDSPRDIVETTLLILPLATPDFDDFNDLLADAAQLVRDRRLTGDIQVVGFHPHFRFADGPADDPAHYTNRSPYPMIHLLREVSVSEVNDNEAAIAAIPRRNADFLRRMGRSGIEARLDVLKADGEVGQ